MWRRKNFELFISYLIFFSFSLVFLTVKHMSQICFTFRKHLSRHSANLLSEKRRNEPQCVSAHSCLTLIRWSISSSNDDKGKLIYLLRS